MCVCGGGLCTHWIRTWVRVIVLRVTMSKYGQIPETSLPKSPFILRMQNGL